MQAGSTQLSSFDKLHEYEKRSLAHSDAGPSEQDRAANWAGVVFRAGEYRLACSISDITEILNLPIFTPIPGAKPWVLGLANVRGNLLTVCDLIWALTGVRTPLTGRTRLLVTRMEGLPVGLIVDEVFGQRHFHTDDAKKTRKFQKTSLKPFVKTHYKTHNEDWGILDMDALLDDNEFRNGAA